MTDLLDVLGGPKAVSAHPENIREWVECIRAGLPVDAALAFKNSLQLNNSELADLLGVNARAVQRWIPGTSRLDMASGDRLVRTAHLYTVACDVFEDDVAAARWLRAPQATLGGAVPLEFAATDVGTRAVEALLARMEHGVYS